MPGPTVNMPVVSSRLSGNPVVGMLSGPVTLNSAGCCSAVLLRTRSESGVDGEFTAPVVWLKGVACLWACLDTDGWAEVEAGMKRWEDAKTH